jgi:hypothetical protein
VGLAGEEINLRQPVEGTLQPLQLRLRPGRLQLLHLLHERSVVGAAVEQSFQSLVDDQPGRDCETAGGLDLRFHAGQHGAAR